MSLITLVIGVVVALIVAKLLFLALCLCVIALGKVLNWIS